jgi:hypothetical protein
VQHGRRGGAVIQPAPPFSAGLLPGGAHYLALRHWRRLLPGDPAGAARR